MATSYAELPNKLVSSADRVDYAYRHAGEGEVPLVLLQHLPDEELHSLAQPRASEGVLALEDVLALGAETSVLSLPPMGLSD